MDFTVTKEDKQYILDIVMPKGTVEKEINTIAKAIQPNVDLKGFRKGNVPIDVVKSQYNREIRAEVSTRLLYQAVAEILEKEKIKNVSNPELEESQRPSKNKPFAGTYGLDGTLKFKVTVAAPPEVTVKRYKDIEVEVESASFEEWADKEILKQQVAFGDKQQVSRKSKMGDEIVADFKGMLDGKEFEGGTYEDFILVLGSGDFIPGFEEAFVDREEGEEFTTKVTFPPNYMQAQLAGKEAVFECKLKEIYEVLPHPLNEDLALMLSYDSVEELMESYQSMWEEEFSKPLRSQTFNSIMDVLLEENPFDAPNNWVEQEMKLTLARMGMRPEQIDGNEPLFNSVQKIAERSVKISYLLDVIFEQEPELELTVEDIQKIADKEGAQHGISGEQYLDTLRKSNQYATFISFQEQNKTVDYLINSAKIKEKVNE